MTTSLHQEIRFDAPPAKVYDALMSTEQHAAFTGGVADISPDEGGSFSCHDGQISGRNIELLPGKRIVQAWRVGMWDEGVYSLVRMELRADGGGTKLVLDHSGIEEEQSEHLGQGWEARYWTPLREYLAS